MVAMLATHLRLDQLLYNPMVVLAALYVLQDPRLPQENVLFVFQDMRRLLLALAHAIVVKLIKWFGYMVGQNLKTATPQPMVARSVTHVGLQNDL